MLSGSRHLIIFLQSLHHRRPQFSHQIRAFSINFLIPSPTLISPYVENGRIYIGISQQTGFPSGNLSHLINQIPVPGVPQSQLSGEISGDITFNAPYSFICKIDRYSQTGFLDEKTLNFIQCPRMFGSRPHIFVIGRRKPPLPETVQMLVDSPHTVFPQHIFPIFLGKIVFQHTPVTI